MKHYFFFLLTSIILIPFNLSAQNLSTAPTSEAEMFSNARGGNPTLNLVMMDIRNNPYQKDLGDIVGTPYSTENFVRSTLFYMDEPQGEFYVRYNALNSLIEIKKSQLPEEEHKQLYADKDVSIKYLNKVLRFTTYINKKKETKNGYLSLIHDGKTYKLYHRLAVKYSEGKAAANSMVADIPSRYTHFEEFYYQKTGVNRIDFLPTSKGRFIKQFDKNLREEIKNYIKEKNTDLNNEEDLIALFEFINSTTL